jgi:hypothetical protein
MNSKLPNQITVANGSGRSGLAIQKNGRKIMSARSVPLPGAPTVGVWSREGPKPTSESVLCVPNLDGDARGVHGGLFWFRQKKVLRPAGRGEYYIPLHLSACVGVTSCERGIRSQVSEKKWEYMGDCLRYWSSTVGRWLAFFACPSSAPLS